MSSTSLSAAAPPTGSLVLITGITGFLASHAARLFLERGYRVRGTVRSLAAASWVVDSALRRHAAHVELVEVPDMGTDGAFDGAVKGVAAIIHVATSDFLPDPEAVIPRTVGGMKSLLELASRETSVRRFVYTSSMVTQTRMRQGNTARVGPDTFNDEVVEVVTGGGLQSVPEPLRADEVYQASKVLAEKAMWSFVSERKPHFTVNSVHPAMIIGEPLSPTHSSTVYAWAMHPWNGNTEFMSVFKPTYMGDVKDTALLHVAAALDPDLKNTRVSAWGHAVTSWNRLLTTMRALRPDHRFIDDPPEPQEAPGLPTTDMSEALRLLAKWGDQAGWTPLEESIKESLKYAE